MKEVLKEFHIGTSAGHLEVTNTLERLKQHFNLVGCHQAVTDWITGCTQCIADKCLERRSKITQQEYSSIAHLVRIAITSDRMKARYERVANPEVFHEGQLVLFYNPMRKKGLFPKLQTSWDGPYKIVKRLNDVVYRIQKPGNP